MKTIRFEASLGIVSGYGGDAMLTAAAAVPAEAVGVAWQEAAAAVMAETGVYVSATVIPHCWGRAVYHTDWGCPCGGEPVAIISGTLNPMFGEEGAWRQAVLKVLRCLKDEFHQSTVTVCFSEVDMEYLST